MISWNAAIVSGSVSVCQIRTTFFSAEKAMMGMERMHNTVMSETMIDDLLLSNMITSFSEKALKTIEKWTLQNEKSRLDLPRHLPSSDL
jgi:hypothetical protein